VRGTPKREARFCASDSETVRQSLWRSGQAVCAVDERATRACFARWGLLRTGVRTLPAPGRAWAQVSLLPLRSDIKARGRTPERVSYLPPPVHAPSTVLTVYLHYHHHHLTHPPPYSLAMATKPPTREQLMSLPSFSASLSTLPNATSFNGLHLHANFTTTIQHTAESAAKVRTRVSPRSRASS
jgi:hypothetical protein